jgi:hypothetical protein
LREVRDIYLQAYHRALRLILTHSLRHPRAAYWADACELYERRYQELDQRINHARIAAARVRRAA